MEGDPQFTIEKKVTKQTKPAGDCTEDEEIKTERRHAY